LKPDEKMDKAGEETVLPDDEFSALKTYRTHWKANSGNNDYENKTQNTCRFLLVGRPQIEKTDGFSCISPT
jgi:hypothetical protein